VDDWECWTIREDSQGNPYGLTLTKNKQNKLEFTVDFSTAPENKGQIFYTVGEGGICRAKSPPFASIPLDSQLSFDVRMFEDVQNIQAEIFLQDGDPVAQTYGDNWYAGRDASGNPTDLNPGALTTVRAVQWVTGDPPIPAFWTETQKFISLGIEFKIKENLPIPGGIVTFEIAPVKICYP